MAQSQQQAQQPPPEVIDAVEALPEGEQLTLLEMSRIMDVASTLRKERALVEQQLNIDEIKAELRRRLLDAARVTGDTITEAEVDVAVDQYYDRMHTFKEPPLGLETMLAHAYVRRGTIIKWAIAIGAVLATFWGMFLAGLLPGERRYAMLANQQFATVEQRAAAIDEMTDDSAIEQELAAIVDSARAFRAQRDPEPLETLAADLQQLQSVLAADYVLTIPSTANEESAFPMDFTDESGTRRSGYYVIVEAQTPDGKAVTVPIRDRQTGETRVVSRWAEQVPEAVYNRLREDKADGVLDERIFGRKQRGERELTVDLEAARGGKLGRLGQLTAW